MRRIQQLDPLVINKIAAGEVIERPASIVKELLENSIDALSTRVEVDIARGGTELIRVVDDGEGIHPDDMLLAVTSHATSKIRNAEELFLVRSLGFRGEALASIASVSRFRVRSRTAEADSATELEVHSGRVDELRPCAGPPGTLIEVSNLFASTPVRRKYLRTAATEFGHISEVFTRIALANPRLHAVLRHNGKTVFELPPTERVVDRLRLFFGDDLAENLISVESQSGDIRLWGYTAHPSRSKSTRKGQYLFLNGRWIQDRALQHALGEAYRGLLMVGRYPISFLFLEVPPELVDVNVHPTKCEVRFTDGQVLYRQLLGTLRDRFLGMDLDSTMSVAETRQRPDGGSATGSGATASTGNMSPADTMNFSPGTVGSTGSGGGSRAERRELQRELASWAREQLNGWAPSENAFALGETVAPVPLEPANTQPDGEGEDSPQAEADDADGARSEFLEEQAPGTGVEGTAGTAAPAPGAGEMIRRPEGDAAGRTPRVMQIHDCYLVMETDEGITVIDQHALHERILYEQLRRRVLAGAMETQRLLLPLTVELSSREAAVLTEHRELLAQLGFPIEPFGGQTVLVTGYPSIFRSADHTALVRDLAERLLEAGARPSRRDILDSLLHMMSCKAAIKSGQRLSPEEMQSLLAARHLCTDAHHCPHGRPTALSLSREDLDRQFGRLG